MQSDKNFVRRQIAAERKAYTELFRSYENEAIRHHILLSEQYRSAQTILCYVSFGAEVDTHKLIRAMIADGKTVCVPQVTDKRGIMRAVRLDSWSQLAEGTYGILEVADEVPTIIESTKLDLILVPAVAFTLSGKRLGMGGGFYDRYLSQSQAQTMGLAFLCQIKEELPTDEWDRRMDFIVTKNGVTDCQAGRRR